MSTGFVIVNEHEEFLANLIDHPGAVFSAWSKFPFLAKVFPDRKKCQRAIRLIGKHKYRFSIQEIDP